MTAARTGNVDALKTLIAHGAQIDRRDARGQSPLMWAAARNNADAVRLLIESGADLTVRTSNTPSGRGGADGGLPQPASRPASRALLFAVRSGSLDAVKALLDAGADVNDTLSDGESALVVAAANAQWEVASLLLDRGADPNHAGAGWNALHQTIHSRRPNLGYTPGPVSDRIAGQHRGREEAHRQGDRRQRPHVEERHEGRAAQPRQPPGRHRRLPGRQDDRPRSAAGAAGRRRRREHARAPTGRRR